MKLNEHRKSIARVLIRGINTVPDYSGTPAYRKYALAFHDDSVDSLESRFHPQRDTCIATGMFFPDNLSAQQITMSDYGPIWMGLWLDCEVRLDDTGDGNTLFPRWLAEVLNEECALDIQEADIYDEEDE